MSKVLNIAHRGFSGLYPENTMIAFTEAINAGCDGIETDLHMTKDGVLVLCHDETIDRTTDGTGYIREYNFSELQRFNAGGEKIPNLEEFLDFVKDKNLLINLELKNDMIDYEGMEEKIIKKVYDYKLEEKVILSSFNHYSMVKVKNIDSKIRTGLLYYGTLYKAYEYAEKLKADALHPHFTSIKDKKMVKKIRDMGIMINVYTANEEEDFNKLIDLGVDAIITNYPNKLKTKV